jgi:hypothetical protein
MKVSKWIGVLLLGAFLLVVLIYGVLVVINWNDRPPSAAARQFEQILAARPAVAAADNALVYIQGFGAPTDGDPVELGSRRMAWLETYDVDTSLDSDPVRDGLSFSDQGSPFVTHVWNACGQDADRKQCASVFESAARDWLPTDLDALALRRYEALLTRRAWRDTVPLDVAAPLPAYQNVMLAQRMYLLRLAQWALQGRVDEVRDGLSADFAFWRTAVPAADSLIGQMIAVAALRQHFFFSSLVLRNLSLEQAALALPVDWTREFTAAERSMRRVLAAETASMKRILVDGKRQAMEGKAPAGAEDPGFGEKWLGRATDPLFQLQDTVNARADHFTRLCETFEVPMNQYLQAQKTWNEQDRKPGISMYNPVGAIVSMIDAGSYYVQYTLRTASVEGMRRAALLSVQLRGRGIAPEAAGAEVVRSELRDPYTDKPFEWNAARHSVTFTAPEDHHWRRVEFFY